MNLKLNDGQQLGKLKNRYLIFNDLFFQLIDLTT